MQIADWILAVDVEVAVDVVQSLHHLMNVDEGTDQDQAAQNIPQPEGSGAQLGVHAAASCLVAHTLGQVVHPDQGINAQGDGCQVLYRHSHSTVNRW